MITNQGLNYLINSAMPFGVTGQDRITGWFLIPFANNRTPQATDTMAGVVTAYGEITQYGEANRPELVLSGASTAQTINNFTSPTEYAFNNTGDLKLRGFMVGSTHTKSNTTGTLLSASLLQTARDIFNGDEYAVKWSLSMSNPA